MPVPPSKHSTSDDALLLARCFDHDQRAWDEFVERFSPLIFSVIHHTLGRYQVRDHEAVVDDLFHQAFLALYDNDYRKLRQWSHRCSVASWIRLVTSSVVVDALRRRKPQVSLDAIVDAGGGDAHLPPVESNTVALLERVEVIEGVRRAMKKLSKDDRELLTRLFVDQSKPEAVAARLGIRVGTLYTRKNRALGRLRVHVQGSLSGGDEDP